MKNEDEWESENLKISNDYFQTKTYINDDENNDFSVEHLKKGVFSPWHENTPFSMYVIPRIVGLIVVLTVGCSGILSGIDFNIQLFWCVFIGILLSSLILYILRCI